MRGLKRSAFKFSMTIRRTTYRKMKEGTYIEMSKERKNGSLENKRVKEDRV